MLGVIKNENNMDNFKGIYYNDNNEQNYFENGAHFKYREMCGKLEKLVLTLSPGRRGKTMYEDSEFSYQKEFNSVERTKAESRKFASDNSKCTLSAPKSVNKDFMSPNSIKSDIKSIKNIDVNISNLRRSDVNNNKLDKRINVSQNKNFNYSLAKGSQNHNKEIELIINNLDNKQNFKKVIPKIGSSTRKDNETNNRFLQNTRNNAYITSNKTLIHEINEKVINQEKLLKKIQQKSVNNGQNKINNYSSFSRQTFIKKKSNHREPTPSIQIGFNESNILQKSFFKDKTKQNEIILSKNSSQPSDISNITESIIKSQNMEKTFLNAKSRNINRFQNKLEVGKTSFKEKNPLKLHTVDNNLNKINKENFITKTNIKQKTQSLERKIKTNKFKNTTCLKSPNKLMKSINQNIKKTFLIREMINTKNPHNNITNNSKIKGNEITNLRNKKLSIDITVNHSKNKISHIKNLSQQSISKITKQNIISIYDKKILVKGNDIKKGLIFNQGNLNFLKKF